ncbi:MAG: phosphatidylglycerol lysyltransferase domain-containing protein [Oscillospiraceae bacterium]
MLELQEITVDKKELFNKYLSRKCSQNSEFTFTNFFMWRKSYDMKYVIINDMLCIMPRHNGGPRSATFPIGFKNEDGTNPDIVPVINELLNYFEKRNEEPLIRLYDDTAVQMLIESFPGRFLITEDVNYFDYVYNIDELIKLPGKRFHGKRNHVNKFKTTYNWEYNSLNAKNCNECLALFDKWFENKVDEISGVDEEFEAVHELFNNWEALDIKGGCIRVDGEMVAFSVGEPLCEKMVVIHLEHANTGYNGAFPIMNQQFLEHEWNEYELVNREEDMGIDGLRRAKESYRPVSKVKKYVATLL